ncbi:hypothetical protein J2800_003487 [Caulobacter rhizosphaerae]|uniref:VCBS repeat protein n=1 Tax=Caulobacter rhizosphaerae TaxID=2010972 RepID=A0ABU1N2U4_9CAUL|nr:FG-GAP-like repeat-containing protein [Caulobacter rhizosphaerae]MDR6532727.1 hypothetical protein [Caulobacter rhizosphaerae]
MQIRPDQPAAKIDTNSGEATPPVTVLTGQGSVVVWDTSVPARVFSDVYTLYADVFDAAGALIRKVTVASSAAPASVDPRPQVVALTNGGFAVAWHATYGYVSEGAAFQTFDATGVATSAVFSIPNSVDGESIVALPNGGVALAWTQKQASGAVDAYTATFNSAGQVSATTQLTHLAATAHVDPPIVTALASGYAVSWISVLDAQTASVFTSIFNANGVEIGQPIAVSGPFSTTIKADLNVATTASGGFTLTWLENDGGANDIHRAVYAANGAQIAASEVVAHGRGVEVAALADGHQALAWVDGGVTFKILDADGHAITGPIAVTHDDTYGHVVGDIAVAAVGDGNQFVVSWTQTTAETGQQSELFVAVYDSTGHRVAEAVNIAGNPYYDESTPSIDTFSDGHFVIGWTSGRFFNDGYTPYVRNGVFKAELDPTVELSIGSVDLNGDGRSDVLMRNHEGDLGSYQLVGGQYQWSAPTHSLMTYSLVGVGDFNGDHATDVLFRNNISGDLGFNRMVDGQNVGYQAIGSSSTAYAVVATGDFDHNGTSDILFRGVSGDLGYYRMSEGAVVSWGQIGTLANTKAVAGVGDFDGDGDDDILYRTLGSGAGGGDLGFYHLQNGAVVGQTTIASSSPAYSVVGVADFDGDGSADILFRNDKTGDTGFYKIDHGQFVDWVSVGSSSAAYRVVNVGDFDINGSVDILFQNEFNHDLGYYALDHGHFVNWIGVATTADGFFGV